MPSAIEEVTSTIEEVTTAMKAKESTSTTTIIDLPDELLSLILSKLSLEDKLRYECVCKLWKKLIYEQVDKVKFFREKPCPYMVWKNWCREDEHEMCENDFVSIKLLPIIVNKCKYLRAIDLEDFYWENDLIKIICDENYLTKIECLHILTRWPAYLDFESHMLL